MALRGASRAQLLKTGQLRFAGVFSEPLFDGRNPDPGKTVIGYRGDRGALVKDGGGHTLLLKSTLPLQAPAANGELAPVDLSLRESTQTFTTANSNADVQIFKDPAHGISFLQQGFSVSDATAADGAQPDGTQTDGRVFFAQAEGGDSDVSFIAVPKPTGVQVGWLLATADAPETYQLNLDLPEGAKVRRTQTDDPIPGDPPRTFEIVDRDGKSLAYITPPMTVDSDGVNVESSMHVVGRDRLVVDVKHHGEDLHYPLFVDPELLAVPRGRSAADWQGWGTYQTPTTATRIASDYNYNYYGWALDHPAYNPSGAYMSMPTHTWFDLGTGRGFEYRAPPGTYIATATFGNISHAAIWPTGTYNMWWQGILNPSRSAWQNVSSSYASGSASASAFSTADAAEQNYANIGIMATGANYQGRLWSGDLSAWVKMDWANVYLGDNHPPVLTSAPPANENWSTATSRTRTVSATDEGTKIVTFRLTGPGIDQTTQPSWGEPQTIQYTPAEGSHTYTLTATDAVGNTSTPQAWTEKIDRGRPVIDVSGALKDKSGQQVTEGFWTMDVSAKDEAADRSTSGVKSIKITVDGKPLTVDGEDRSYMDSPAGCEGASCPLDYDEVPFYTHEYAAGSRTILVTATDYAGNTTTEQLDVTNSNNRPASEAQARDSSPPFNVYHVSGFLESLEMKRAVREHILAPPDAPELGRQDSVTYSYGECLPFSSAEAATEGGCLPPIEIQSTPMCEKHKGLYGDVEAGAWNYVNTTVKGVPAALFDGGRIIEIYTGTTTITIYGESPAQVLRFAEVLTLSAAQNIPTLAQPLTSLVSGLELPSPPTLPPPDLAILAQTEPCT